MLNRRFSSSYRVYFIVLMLILPSFYYKNRYYEVMCRLCI